MTEHIGGLRATRLALLALCAVVAQGCFAGMRLGKAVELGSGGPPAETYAEFVAGITVEFGGNIRGGVHGGRMAIAGESDSGTMSSGGSSYGLNGSYGLWEAKWKEDSFGLRARVGGHVSAGGTTPEGVSLKPKGGGAEAKSQSSSNFTVGVGAEAGLANLREDNWNDGIGVFVGVGLASGRVGTEKHGSTTYVAPYLSGVIEWYPWGFGRFNSSSIQAKKARERKAAAPKYQGADRCPKCAGRGTVRCKKCNGSGLIYDSGHLKQGRYCRACNGGKVTCPICNGTGRKK